MYNSTKIKIIKLLFSMTRFAFLVTIVTMTLSGVLMGADVKSQNLNEAKITLTTKNTTVAEVLTKIEQQTEFSFSFSKKVGELELGSFQASNKSLEEVLMELAKVRRLKFSQLGDLIAVSELPKPPIPGKISGKVLDEKGEPLPGATVKAIEVNRSTSTNLDGTYILSLDPGTYILEASFMGYEPQRVTGVKVDAGQITSLNIKLQFSSAALGEVVVSAFRRMRQPVQHSTETDIVQEIKLSSAVISGISSEQIGKLADTDAAQVSRRIAGVTVTDEQFLVVRGMNPRYNVTYLGDNLAPSTEQYSRAFALDLIPSRIINKIMLYKSPQPDLFGDFAGGAVKVDIKDALAVKHFDVGLRIGYLPVSTFKDVISYKGSKTDWIGFDDGKRELPKAVPGFGNFQKAQLTPQQYVQAFDSDLTYGNATALPDMQLSINYYDGFNIGKTTKLFNVTAFAFTNEARFNTIYRQQGNTLDGFDSRYSNSMTDETRSTETGQLNLMQNFTLKLNNRHQLYFKNFILQRGQKSTQVRISRPNNGLNTVAYNKSNVLGYNSRLLYTGNIGGNRISDDKKKVIDWNLGYTGTRYELPDQRVINFTASSTDLEADYSSLNWVAAVRTDGDAQASRRQGIISRQFLDSREKLYNGSLDYTYSFGPKWDVKAGMYHFWKERNVFRRVYVVHDALFTTLGDFANRAYLPGRDEYVSPEHVWFREQDLAGVWSTDYFRDDRKGLALYDFTSPSDAYIASEQYHAGYAKVSARPFGEKLEFSGGARLEYDRQKLAAAEETSTINVPQLIDREKAILLPSIIANFRPNNKWVFRASYGKTVNRPEFREMTPFADFDYLNNEEILGNAELVTATIDNIDMRIEFYADKNKGESLSLGGFYKYLDKPIERINFSDLSSERENPFTQITFRNADKARVYGLEAEIRKSMAFIPGKLFRDISLVANLALIHSETRKDSIRDDERDQALYARTFKRPLQGQAPYIVNVGFFHDNRKSGTGVSVSWNVSGTSIYAAGVFTENNYLFSSTRGSILQLPQHSLDAALKQKIGKGVQAKFSVQNLLNSGIKWVEDNDFNNEYNPEKLEQIAVGVNRYSGDNIYQEFNPGRRFFLSVICSF